VRLLAADWPDTCCADLAAPWENVLIADICLFRVAADGLTFFAVGVAVKTGKRDDRCIVVAAFPVVLGE